jgi:hypothetical protein
VIYDLGVSVTDGRIYVLAAATTITIDRSSGIAIGPNAANLLYVQGMFHFEVQ